MEINNKTLMWIVIAILLLALIYVTFFRSGGATGAVTAGGSGKIDTAGWTDNEIMNYEMHGTVPARVQGSASAGSSGGMVGGC